MTTILNKNTLLSVVMAVVTLLIIYRITPVTVDPVLELVISKNRVGINSINQQRDITNTQKVMVDILNIAEQNRFKHPKLGELGYGNDFFVDVETTFTVKKAGSYHFLVGSDDGFKLLIDGKPLCQFPGSRPLAVQTCAIDLTEGEHVFKLAYYQGFGNAGLKVEYRLAGNNSRYWIGQNSSFLRFH